MAHICHGNEGWERLTRSPCVTVLQSPGDVTTSTAGHSHVMGDGSCVDQGHVHTPYTRRRGKQLGNEYLHQLFITDSLKPTLYIKVLPSREYSDHKMRAGVT